MAMRRDSGKHPVDVAQIMEDFGCSERQVGRFVAQGMPKAGHGRYDRLDCLRWYARKLETDLASVQSRDHDLEYEQMRERRATADLKELELAEMRRRLIPAEICRQHTAAHFAVVRRNIMAIAEEIAPQLERQTRAEIRARLQQRHRQVLAELATGREATKALAGESLRFGGPIKIR